VEPVIALLTELAKLITPLLLITLAIQQWMAKRAVARVRKALVITNADQNTKLDGIAEQTDKVHTLVNSNMGAQLTLTAKALRRVAELTGDAVDHAIADEAEKLARDHAVKQNKVDDEEARDLK
jgi:hypothetical protein